MRDLDLVAPPAVQRDQLGWIINGVFHPLPRRRSWLERHRLLAAGLFAGGLALGAYLGVLVFF